MSLISPTLAERIEQEWRTHSNQPIAMVAGDVVLAGGTAYYLRSDVLSFAMTEQAAVKAEIIKRGGALVCPAEDNVCVAAAEKIVAEQNPILRGQVWLHRQLFGFAGGTRRDVYFLVPPRTVAN